MSERKPFEWFVLYVLVQDGGENDGRPMPPLDGNTAQDHGFIVYRSHSAAIAMRDYQHGMHPDLKWRVEPMRFLDPKWLAPVGEVEG